MTVTELMERMDAHEFAEWQVYYSMEPFGHERLDWNFGMVASVLAQCHATRGHHYKPADFMPKFRRQIKHKGHPTRGRDEFLNWAIGKGAVVSNGKSGH